MLKLADLAEDASSLDGYRWEDRVTLACSMCESPFQKRKGHILKALKANQPGSYCSQKCRGQHVLQEANVVRDGVGGRVCTECQEWVPLAKMTAKGRARVCMVCRRNQPKNRFSILRSQAKHRGHAWTLIYNEMMLLWKRPCHYCGDPIERIRLDRVDPDRGYELGNVVSCCHPCNRGKGDNTQEEFLARCRRVSERVGSTLD